LAAISKAYGKLAQHLFLGRINWQAEGGSTIKCALLKNTYIPDQDTDTTWEDISSHEVSGTGYTPGGNTLVLRDVAYDPDTNTLKVDAEDTLWPELTLTARHSVVYVEGATDAESWLIAYTDFGVDKPLEEESLKVIFNIAGIVSVSVA